VRKARIISQILFLAAFLALLIGTRYTGTDHIPYPAKVFLELDPLIALSTVLSAHWVPWLLLLSLIVVGVTLVLGRVFCGWVCPFGTLLQATRAALRKNLPTSEGIWRPWQSWKYLILIAILVLAVFGLNLSGFMDPISLTIRSLSLSIGPALEKIARAVLDLFYAIGGPFAGAADASYDLLRSHLLSFEQPQFSQALAIGVIFIALFGLIWIVARFWCRALCPLGALLGYLSRRSMLRLQLDPDLCTACGDCLAGCQGAAEPGTEDPDDLPEEGHKSGRWRISECMHCWNCVSTCPTEAISYKMTFSPKSPPLDLGRRRVLAIAGGAAAAAPLLSIGLSRARANPALIRPPGSVNEKDFLERCVKCGECMKVCPTNCIHPTLFQAGFEGMWSPVMNFKAGYCEFNCTLCGQVCPTQAIERLKLEEKQNLKIGLAFIDVNRCLPYAFETPCIVCEEHCPTPTKAIWFEEKEILKRDGSTEVIKLPHVDPDLCIGCGICENKCPVSDRPAIYCTSAGEDRNPDNQPILTF
jgi:polyferredoxin